MNKICVAGKNRCSIEILSLISKKIDKKYLLVLPNENDNGIDSWQPSLKNYAKKNNININNLKNI